MGIRFVDGYPVATSSPRRSSRSVLVPLMKLYLDGSFVSLCVLAYQIN